MGSKWETKYNENPPPGIYDTEKGHKFTKDRISSAFIYKENGYKVLRE